MFGKDPEHEAANGRMTRRSFLVWLLGLAGALGGAGLTAPIARFVYPATAEAAQPRIQVANTADLSPLQGIVEFEYQGTPCSLLQLEDGSYRALSRVCTHFGCIISWEPEDEHFRCPCHAGFFAPTGEVLSGPPPSPLPQLEVEIDGKEIFVNGWTQA